MKFHKILGRLEYLGLEPESQVPHFVRERAPWVFVAEYGGDTPTGRPVWNVWCPQGHYTELVLGGAAPSALPIGDGTVRGAPARCPRCEEEGQP